MSNRKPKVWITYAWADNELGDFSYLVQRLEAVGVEAKYDRIALVAGKRLWEQIGEQIVKGDIDGWAYLVTPKSIASEPCREELAYALYRALQDKEKDFPVIGLVHGVKFDEVPPSLTVRLCVPLSSPTWTEELKSALEHRPPRITSRQQSKYAWTIHSPYRGDQALIAVEVRPRFGELMWWRFVVPVGTAAASWGYGPSGGQDGVAAPSRDVVDGGNMEVNGTQMQFFGSGDKLTPAVGAYVVFSRPLPEYVAFGLATERFGGPSEVETLRLQSC